MTSRQPGTTPRETTWLVRLLPLILLIILGLAGLRGGVGTPQWNGPLHRDSLLIGPALEVVLGALLVITLRRRGASRQAGLAAAVAQAAAPVNVVAAKLRVTLAFVLSTGMAAVAVTTIVGLRLHLFTPKVSPLRPQAARTARPLVSPHRPPRFFSFHLALAPFLYALLIVLLIAGVLLSIWWIRRPRPSIQLRAPRSAGFMAEDSENLREAVESGRSALRTLDDARTAIIACYVAMEASLAERGAARTVADTPDELLTRARQSGLIRWRPAARLTALFYEARFSSHALDRGQRDAAEQALDELAAALTGADAGPSAGAGAETGAGS